MNYAKKMLLIDPSVTTQLEMSSTLANKHLTAERLQPLEKKELTRLDREMADILNNEALSAERKVAKYNEILSKFQQNYSQETTSSAISTDGNKTERTVSPDYFLFGIPKTYKNKANELKALLQNSEHIKWNSAGTIFLDGKELQGSNISDYINNAINPQSKLGNLPHWSEFYNKLQVINVPKSILRNKAVKVQDINTSAAVTPSQKEVLTPSKKTKYSPRHKRPNWITYET